jgi:hypothetical protein
MLSKYLSQDLFVVVAKPFGEVRWDLSRVQRNWTIVLKKLDQGLEIRTLIAQLPRPKSEPGPGTPRPTS